MVISIMVSSTQHLIYQAYYMQHTNGWILLQLRAIYEIELMEKILVMTSDTSLSSRPLTMLNKGWLPSLGSNRAYCYIICSPILPTAL